MNAIYSYERRGIWFYVYKPDGTKLDDKALTQEEAKAKVYELNGWNKQRPTTGKLIYNSPSGNTIELECGKFSWLQSARKLYIQRGYIKERLKVTY
jgi:hypothetical protein